MDPDPACHSNVDPASEANADPGPQPWYLVSSVVLVIVPRRLFFAALQWIAIAQSPK